MPTIMNPFNSRGATLDDLDIAVRLINNYSKHYLDTIEASKEVFYNEWISPGFNPKTDIQLVFSPNQELIGYVEVWDNANPPVHPWVWWCVHPDHTKNGVGSFLLSWAENRARMALDRCPENARVAFRSGADQTILPAIITMEKHGMVNIRKSFHMQINMETPPPNSQWPEGIRLKTFDLQNDDLGDIYRADLEAFQDHFGFVESPFEEGFKRFKHFMTNEETYAPGLWFLAMTEDSTHQEEIAGFCLNRKHSFEDPSIGWVSSLGVLRPWRNRGIGLALLLHSFGEYYRRGYRKVGLGVDAENLTGALNLYKKAGMHIHRQFDLYEKELRPGVEISVQSLEN
jgi:mycothiol synthase